MQPRDPTFICFDVVLLTDEVVTYGETDRQREGCRRSELKGAIGYIAMLYTALQKLSGSALQQHHTIFGTPPRIQFCRVFSVR